MNYTRIEGFRGGTLVYLQEEKHLFYHTNDRNNHAEYCCYENILPNEYSKVNREGGSEKKKLRCPAKVFVSGENVCRRNKMQHHDHGNHDFVFRDLTTLHETKEKCRFLSQWCPLSAFRISAREIFMVELAK